MYKKQPDNSQYFTALKTPPVITSKPVNLKYLYEIVAIPRKAREEYLNKLSKKLSSRLQKNVKLLKIIYWHLEEDRMLLWNDIKICRLLNISKEMLYCHKSRLRKGLREFYFGWKEIERKEFHHKNCSLQTEFEKAMRMLELGMEREAKNIFCRLKNIIESSQQERSLEESIILFHITDNLCRHYYIQKKSLKFLLCYDSVLLNGSRLLRSGHVKKDEKISSRIRIAINRCRILKQLYTESNLNKMKKAVIPSKLLITESIKIRDKGSGLRYIQLTELYYNIQELTLSRQTALDGLEFCRKNEDRNAALVLQSFLLLEGMEACKEDPDVCIRKFFKLYAQIKDTKGNIALKKRILNNGIILISKMPDKKYMHYLFYEYNSLCILSSGFNSALRTLFLMKFTYYKANIFKTKLQRDKSSGKNYLTVTEVNLPYYEKYSNVLTELQVFYSEVKNIYFRRSTLVFTLFAELCKGKSCSRDYADHLLSQINNINKTRPELKNMEKEAIEKMDLCISILNDSVFFSVSDLWKRYESKIYNYAKTVETTADSGGIVDIDGYLMLSFVAERTGCHKMQQEIRKLYYYITEKHPFTFNHIIRNPGNQSNDIIPGIRNEFMGKYIAA